MTDMGDVLDARQASKYLKIREQTIRRLARDNEIPAFKVGGVWRFKRSTLDRWAEEQQGYRKHKNVLVIDDEEDVRTVVRESLEAADFKVSSASGGAEALKVMTQALPDLVILDLKMRQMDGPTVLKEIRSKWGSVSVVVLTGYPESDLMTRALVYSPLTLLSKPFTPDQLVETVKSILGGEGRSNAAR